MCFSKPPAPPKPPPMPNRADEMNQQAVQGTLQRARNQNASAATTLTGGLGDPNYGKGGAATVLGRTA